MMMRIWISGVSLDSRSGRLEGIACERMSDQLFSLLYFLRLRRCDALLFITS